MGTDTTISFAVADKNGCVCTRLFYDVNILVINIVSLNAKKLSAVASE